MKKSIFNLASTLSMLVLGAYFATGSLQASDAFPAPAPSVTVTTVTPVAASADVNPGGTEIIGDKTKSVEIDRAMTKDDMSKVDISKDKASVRMACDNMSPKDTVGNPDIKVDVTTQHS